MAIMSKEYYADIESVYKKPEDYELAGKGNAYIRIDAEAKVTGTAVYTDDVYLPGMYYCKLVHSPYAHALIKSIDFSEALKVPGVKGVLTGADFPEGHNLGNPEAFKELADKEPLCRKKVRMVGDEVAAVCATTEEIATYAASLVKVEYEPLEPVLDPFYSMQPDAPAIHYPGTSNLSIFTTMKAGDPDKAFAEAYYTDKHYYRTQEMVHAAIEPHGAVAKYENGECNRVDDHPGRIRQPLLDRMGPRSTRESGSRNKAHARRRLRRQAGRFRPRAVPLPVLQDDRPPRKVHPQARRGVHVHSYPSPDILRDRVCVHQGRQASCKALQAHPRRRRIRRLRYRCKHPFAYLRNLPV